MSHDGIAFVHHSHYRASPLRDARAATRFVCGPSIQSPTGVAMNDFERTKTLLDQINRAISGYDPVLKERARDLLLEQAFGGGDRPVTAEPTSTKERKRRTRPEAASASPGTPDEKGRARTRKATSPGRGAGQSAGGRKPDLQPLLDRWSPGRASDRALLAAFSLAPKGRKQLTSQAINDVLKAHDLRVSNITRAIETNLNARPPLMEQVGKRGETKQARKRYRLTEAGVQKVTAQLGE
jgi:hypothetical protein